MYAAKRDQSTQIQIPCPIPFGSGPHDVAPANDGKTIWYTAQQSGQLGRLDPTTRKTSQIPLG
jgi:virginiamycin B lyase